MSFRFQKLLLKSLGFRLLCAMWLCCLVMAPAANAQQREFYNGGFEQNDPQGPGSPNFEIYNNSAVPEWNDITGFIELWDDGFNSTPAFEGNVFAEMNAFTPGELYQEVCLAAGETINWSFAHRARPGGSVSNPQTVRLEVSDLSGSLIQSLATQASTVGGGWTQNTGSAVYTGATGIQRVQFATSDPGSVGNFVDAMFLNIAAFAEFVVSTSAEPEASGINPPSLIINGQVDVLTTIPVSITGGTADASDYTLTDTVVTIPPGNYRNVAFPLPLTIHNNFIEEPDETIEIAIGTPSTSEIVLAKTQCDGTAPITTSIHTILNDDPNVISSKTVETFESSGPGSYALPGNDVVYTLTTTNLGTIDIDGDSIFMIDKMPPEIAFYYGDADGIGPNTDPIYMETVNSSLSFDFGIDAGFSNSTTPPTNMNDCNHLPPGGYDTLASISYICFAPKGVFAAGTPNPSFTFKFRAMIR